MQLIKKHGKIIITAALWLLLFLNLYIRNELLIVSLEKNNLVWYVPGAFANTGNILISALNYLHNFITQFAYYPLLGCLIILLICFIFYFLYGRLFKSLPFSNYWALLFLFGWQITFPYFGLYFLFVGIIVAAIALLVKTIKNKAVRYVIVSLLSVALFFIIKDIIKMGFDALYIRLLPKPLWFFWVLGTRIIICAIGGTLILMPFLMSIAHIVFKKAKFLLKTPAVTCLLALFLIGVSTILYTDHSQKTILKVEKILNTNPTGKLELSQWAEAYSVISDFYKKHEENSVVSTKEAEILSGYAISSFMMSGQNIDKFFDFWGKTFTDIQMFNLMHTYTLPFLLMYYNLGFYAETLHIGYDEIVARNYSFYNLNILINTCFETAEYKPVKKFISLLDKTLFYRNKAVEYREIPQNNISPIERENRNFRVNAYMPDADIMQRAKESTDGNPNNLFFYRYVILRNLITKKTPPEETVTQDNQRTYIQFVRAYDGYLAGRVTKEELQLEFGKTYFYYYYFD